MKEFKLPVYSYEERQEIFNNLKVGDELIRIDFNIWELRHCFNTVKVIRKTPKGKLRLSDNELIENLPDKYFIENEEIRKLKQLNELEEKVKNAIGVIYRKKYSEFFKELEEKDAIKLIEIFSKYINI